MLLAIRLESLLHIQITYSHIKTYISMSVSIFQSLIGTSCKLQEFQANGSMSNVYAKLSTIRDVAVVKSPLIRRFGIVTALCCISIYFVITFQPPSQTELVLNGKASEGITDDDDIGGIDFTLGTIHILHKQ